jgi:hypothetical protein
MIRALANLFIIVCMCFSISVCAEEGQVSASQKRYKYQLDLIGFTPDEVDIFSGIALSTTDNVKATLIKEETKLHFLKILLPTKSMQFELSTSVSPSQFREQMSRLFNRMDVNVETKFIKQENLFETTRAQSPYTAQLFVLWSLIIILLSGTFLVVFWSWVQFKLNLYESGNQSEKWLRLVKALQLFPLPFLCREKWRKQLPHWEKRISQADIWYDNAHQLLRNHEIESANVFVKKSLEVNASNIAAQALESAIAEQLSKHQVIDDERQKFKGLVTEAVEIAQAGNLYKALEKAYLALALCQSHESQNLPVIDLQIDSTKNLIKRISANKSHRCAGLKLISSDQRVHINCGDSMRIGRSPKSNDKIQSSDKQRTDKQNSIDLTFPQDTLSRVNKSIVVSREEHGFSARDIGSTNGLWLQYKQCEADKAYFLNETDQLHLTPPDEIGSVGIQVSRILSNKSICLRLCQNAVLPNINLDSTNNFINPSEYAEDCWYLSNEAFYLVCPSDYYIWYSELEWKAAKSRHEDSSLSKEVLKIDMKEGVWLHILSNDYEVKINDDRIIGPVPLPLISQLSVNDYLIDIVLIPELAIYSEVTEMLRV